jgi:hypothetical protein
LRPLFPGELFQNERVDQWPLPPDHETQVLVRQVKPGFRIRHAFGRCMKTAIPDYEPVIHAIFDVLAETTDRTISCDRVTELARRYETESGPQ